MTDPRAFLRYARPTFLTAWPEALRPLSFRTEFVTLTGPEVDLLRSGPLWKGPVWARRDAVGAGLLRKVHAGLQALGGQAFVRTHTRSPKDSPLFERRRGHADDPWTVLVMLHESHRFHEDARWLALAGELPVIALREWVRLPAGLEFRCFVQWDRVTGIAQRPRRGPAGVPVGPHATALQPLLERFALECGRRSGLEQAVHDLCLLRPPADGLSLAHIRLVEVNPWHAATDRYDFEHRPLDGAFHHTR